MTSSSDNFSAAEQSDEQTEQDSDIEQVRARQGEQPASASLPS